MNQPPITIGAETLSAYLEQNLEPQEQAQVEAKIQDSPEAARELQELQTMLSAMASMPAIEAPRGFSDRLLKNIRRRRWLEDSRLQSQAALVFQILSIIVVIGIAAAYMIAQTESDDRRIMRIEGAKPPGAVPAGTPSAQ